jgi:sugar (pentulose or hexulose) kinase
MLAAALARPIRVAEAAEATALGAAIAAAAGVGLYPDLPDAVRAMARRRAPVVASESGQETYAQIYRRWRRLYDDTADLSAP